MRLPRDRERTVHRRKSTVEQFSDQESYLRAYANACGAFPLSEHVITSIEEKFESRPEWLQRF